MDKEIDNDAIYNKLKTLGLELPTQMQIPLDVKTPPTWIRIRDDKAYVSGYGPQNPDGSIAGPFGKVVEAGSIRTLLIYYLKNYQQNKHINLQNLQVYLY